MSFYADPLLREARERIKSLPNQTAAPSPDSPDFGQLAEAVEKAIKAALIESHGSLPQQHDHDKLVSICQSTGVWDVLPPALRGLIKEVDAYRSTSSRPNSQASVESSREQIQKYFFAARRLIDYMEFHVIGNDSVLKRLKVA
jgi:HEPN domain-containing protein